MSRRGTVLMCNEKTELPFDVKLSRVIFYRYDGVSLDVEEVARVLPLLTDTLKHAQQDDSDSPVHALLETVMPNDDLVLGALGDSNGSHGTVEVLDPYQKIVAQHWKANGLPVENLLREHGDSDFGIRSLGLLCLTNPGAVVPELVLQVAGRAFRRELYDLAAELYKEAEKHGPLTTRDRLTLASALSEAHNSEPAAGDAVATATHIVDELEARMDRASPVPEDLAQIAHARLTLGCLLHWKWSQLGRQPLDLEKSLAAYEKGLEDATSARARGHFFQPGRLANAHLRLLLGLRKRDDDKLRQDFEEHRRSVWALGDGQARDDALSRSYLRWYQAIALAEGGNAEAADQRADHAVLADEQLRREPGCESIGRRQYTLLRRFIEQDSEWFHNPLQLGRISKRLHPHRVGGS